VQLLARHRHGCTAMVPSLCGPVAPLAAGGERPSGGPSPGSWWCAGADQQ